MHSRFEYVRSFEQDDSLLQGAWIVIRIDGRHFHQFSDAHGFSKPNDDRALRLMTVAARAVMNEFSPEVILAIGQSDEYSFVLPRTTSLCNRRSAKLVSTFTSLFTAQYIFNWAKCFPDQTLEYPASFDGRAVLYPTDEALKDYLRWRQVDAHINNLYNVTFWALVQKGGLTNNQAEQKLVGSFSKDKNEILFQQFGVNYNELPEVHKKGTVLTFEYVERVSEHKAEYEHFRQKRKFDRVLGEFYEDICKESSKFWREHPYLVPYEPLSDYTKRMNKKKQASSNEEEAL